MVYFSKRNGGEEMKKVELIFQNMETVNVSKQK